MTTQINAVANPIINSPYEPPKQHWHIEEGKEPQKQAGRRPASYFLRVPEGAARGRRAAGQGEMFDEDLKGNEYLLDLANLLRQRVQDWRDRGYQGATKITRELIDLWRAPDRAQPLFYAQLEAAETAIFPVEGPADLLQGIQVPADEPGAAAKKDGYKAFQRYALKMATGSGKTTVMGMLAAWSILNKGADPQNAAYSDTVLIVCPNVTIRDRLQELNPELDELSLYRTRELVPAHRMTELRRGEVFVTNWHNLERRETRDVNGQIGRVVKRGQAVEKIRTIKVTAAVGVDEIRHQATVGAFEILDVEKRRDGSPKAFTVKETQYLESYAAFLKRVLGGRKGRSSAILVMNDEAHHAYRRGSLEDADPFGEEDETTAANVREATVWIEGLDRINKALGGRRSNGIRLCVDLSATPFYIQGSGNEVGKPFPWVVSDFSLLEAIEAGLVKVPQLPTEDGSGEEVPRYFNVWRWVQKQAQDDGHIGPVTLTEVMRYATAPIFTLAASWRETLAKWQEHFRQGNRRHDVPPVFIVVCHTGKSLHDVQRCHLNAAVFDSDWERQAADLLGSHSAVAAWVKNDRLGLVIPYRKEGTLRKYLPDFVVQLESGEHLIVEIKGQIGDAMLKKAAAERWCRAVTNDGRSGKWEYRLCFGAADLRTVLNAFTLGDASLSPTLMA